jgi:O-antigen ligase
VLGMSGVFLAMNWVAEWNWKEKWNRLMQQKEILVLGGFYFLLILCLFKTNHLPEALNTLIVKLPLLYAPFILGTSSPLNGKEQRWIFNAFIGSTLIATLISVTYLLTHDVPNIRDISLFISHIRFSLCIVLAICLSLYFGFFLRIYGAVIKGLYLSCVVWMLCYLFISQTLTGIIILFIILLFTLFYSLFYIRKIKFQWIIPFLSIIVIVAVSYTIHVVYQYFHAEKVEISSLPTVTAGGKPYTHHPNSIIENGSHTGLYISAEELQSEWGKRSEKEYDGLLEATLIRYLNSKGFTKDSVGMQLLTDKDIQFVEQGIANYDYVHGFGIKRSLYPILFSISMQQIEYSTVLQRVELWRIAIAVIQKNFWSGTGIGDVKEAVDREISLQNSSLIYRKNMGCHNQFLSYFVTGGIFLFLYFLLILFYPFFAMKKKINLLYIAFFILIFCSFFTEDTLGTQAGVTLYAFFNAFFLFVMNDKITEKEKGFDALKKLPSLRIRN